MNTIEIQKNDVNDTSKHLVLLDIDGTITGSSLIGFDDYTTLNPRIKNIAQQLNKEGHILCLSTGRTLLGALKIYDEIGVNSYLSCYNGAYILNPKNEKSLPIIFPLVNELVKNLLKESSIWNNIVNLTLFPIHSLENRDLSALTTSDSPHYRTLFLKEKTFFKGTADEVINNLGSRDVLQIVLEFKKNEEVLNNIFKALRKYRHAIDYYTENKLHKVNPLDIVLGVDNSSITFRVRNKNASKGSAAKIISALYNISLEKTFAFGNDKNDLPVLGVVGRGIVTSDSDAYLKSLAYDVVVESKHKINSESVADYLSDFFGYEKC